MKKLKFRVQLVAEDEEAVADEEIVELAVLEKTASDWNISA